MHSYQAHITRFIAPFVFLWDRLFGAEVFAVDQTRLLFVEVERADPHVTERGKEIVVKATIFRAPAKRVENDGKHGTYITSDKVHNVGIIDRREARRGESLAVTHEIIRERRNLVGRIDVNPGDVVEFTKEVSP